jgi:hypothetical protein
MPRLFHASILALLSTFLLTSCASPLYAAETEVAVGRGFVGDTAQEIKAVATPVDIDISARLASINDRSERTRVPMRRPSFTEGERIK